jgi:uncharacterized cupredoxin-like copper-binding protein
MRLFKKAAALLLAVTLAVPAMSVAAAQDSPQGKAIIGKTTNGTYNGADQSSLILFEDENGAKLTAGEDYVINEIEWTGNDGKADQTEIGTDVPVENAGTYKVKAEGKGRFAGEATATVKIAKADPQLKASFVNKAYQMYKVYNESVSVKVNATAVSDGEITYYLTQYGLNRGFTINGSTVSHPANSDAKYIVGDTHVYAKIAETLNYKATKTQVANITIKKSYPHISFAKQKKTFKKSAVDSKARTYNLGATGEPGTKLAYKSTSKWVTVSKTGKVTVKKGAPKGKYKIQVYNTNTSQYYKGAKNCYVYVK